MAKDIWRIIAQMAGEVPRSSTGNLTGQVQTMEHVFSGLVFGCNRWRKADQMIANPADSLTSTDQVQIAQLQATAAK